MYKVKINKNRINTKLSSIYAVFPLAEKERFELSRRLPDLHP